jgi:molecular chaperone Hsp33
LSQIDRPGEALLRRYIDNKRAIIISEGDFTTLVEGWRHHTALWGAGLDGLSLVLGEQGLAAAALYLANRPRDEVVAWTLNFAQPPTNLFLTGDARESNVTGRVFTEGVKTTESGRLFVQAHRPGREPMESVIEVEGLDVLLIFEQYFERSEQNPARFFELGRGRFLMVLGLPGVDGGWLHGLSAEASLGLVDQARLLEGRVFRFECGCSPAKMMAAVRGIFHANPEELFRGDAQVETSCPRCGRRWWIRRSQFLEEAGGAG